jgi:DNA-binding transcriptional LysR family regulator
MNYREAAEKLNLTQPAVSKQIHSLENEYGVKLFTYDGRHLEKTEKCLILESYAQSLEYNYQEMQLAMKTQKKLHLRVGATKTIGDYVIAPAIMQYLEDPAHELSLIVDNTEQLLKRLDENSLDFAIVEGRFDKKKYQFRLFRKEPFIGIRAKQQSVKSKWLSGMTMEEILSETLIVREKGSGTRELFERDLEGMGYSLNSFSRVIELSSFRLIREAVKRGLGISFLYKAVIEGETGFEPFYADGIQREHEFNVVSLRQTSAERYAEQFLVDSLILK